ncbi:hypothetical protein HDU99_003764 [Rhizoclosmatium hyalinum]|nr:hypothetical protein HDU99_003764 [Rhizoclosmatium hyalinum]
MADTLASATISHLDKRYYYYYYPNYGLYIGLPIAILILIIMVVICVQRSRRAQVVDQTVVYGQPVVVETLPMYTVGGPGQYYETTTTTTTYGQPGYVQQQVVYGQPPQQQQVVYGQPVPQQQQVVYSAPQQAPPPDGRLGTYTAPSYSPPAQAPPTNPNQYGR